MYVMNLAGIPLNCSWNIFSASIIQITNIYIMMMTEPNMPKSREFHVCIRYHSLQAAEL